jgi:hypothetical protein
MGYLNSVSLTSGSIPSCRVDGVARAGIETSLARHRQSTGPRAKRMAKSAYGDQSYLQPGTISSNARQPQSRAAFLDDSMVPF